jgi:hypothetical protein
MKGSPIKKSFLSMSAGSGLKIINNLSLAHKEVYIIIPYKACMML